MYFDTHAHYEDSRFDGDREELLAGLPGRGVGLAVDCGSDIPAPWPPGTWPCGLPTCILPRGSIRKAPGSTEKKIYIR